MEQLPTTGPTGLLIKHDMKLQSFGATDRGCVKLSNEDSFSLFEDINFFALADGMGNEMGGCIASKLAVEFAGDRFREMLVSYGYDESLSPKVILKCLDGVFGTVNSAVRSAGEQEGLDKIGTTLVTLLVSGGIAYVSNIGDSRAYYYGKGRLSQMTRDHSFLEEYRLPGVLLPEHEMSRHPLRHLLTRACGLSRTIKVDHFMSKLTGESDLFLLCSDGLSNMLTDQEIETVMGSQASIEQKGKRLIQLARENGGEDNISVVLVSIAT